MSTLVERFRGVAASRFDAEVDGLDVSWAEYAARVRIAARWLHERGVRRGCVVSIAAPDRLSRQVLDLAVLHCGAATAWPEGEATSPAEVTIGGSCVLVTDETCLPAAGALWSLALAAATGASDVRAGDLAAIVPFAGRAAPARLTHAEILAASPGTQAHHLQIVRAA